MMKKRNITSRLNKVDYLIFSFCSIFAVASLFLFYKDMNSFSLKQDEEPIATISFKENTVQRKLDNRNIWEKVNLACDIYNGDSLRTSNESKVIAAFLENNVKINLDENSMIQLFKNKKKDFIDFIGGEIHIENTSSDAPIIIHAGTKAISIMANSKAKLTAVENDNADEQFTEAIIEVESGEVEITEIQETKTKVIEEEKVTVTAGNILEINIEKELPVESKVEPIVENNKVEEEKEIIEIEETKEELVEEVKIEKPVEKKVEKTKKVEKAEIKDEKPVKQEVKQEKKEEIIYPEVTVNTIGRKQAQTIAMQENVWDIKNDGRNYGYTILLADMIGGMKRIPKGSSVEITMSGISNQRIPELIFQLSTGEEGWVIANETKKVVLNTRGIGENERFTLYTNIYLTKDIVNTSNAYLNLCYDPYQLDSVAIINDFSLSAKIASKNYENEITPLSSSFRNDISQPEVETILSRYNDENGKLCWKGQFCFEANKVFGDYTSIEKGTKLKITLKAISTGKIDWITPELSQEFNGNWKNCLADSNGNTENLLNKSIIGDKEFTTSRIYTVNTKYESSDIGNFILAYYFPNDEKPEGDLIKLKECVLTIEVVE